MLGLTFLKRVLIRDETSGLLEPSGLTLGHGGDGLWTVSDDTKRIFRLSLDGKADDDASFDVPFNGLEGIAIDPTGAYLFAVREETNKIIKLNIAERSVAGSRKLSKMAGYGRIKDLFEDDPDSNKGLEGITWNSDSGSLFVLKEGHPGLLIEVAPDLASLRPHARLDETNGFVNLGSKKKHSDYSGLCYDPAHALFWIVSDVAQRVYLYDPKDNRVVDSASLRYRKKDAYRTVKKAEGVAYDPDSGRLYVVSDEEARLYIFDTQL